MRFVAPILIVALISGVLSSDVYIAPDGGGGDSEPLTCGSSASPCSSITVALQKTLSDGDVLIFNAGTHTQTGDIPSLGSLALTLRSNTGSATNTVIECNGNAGIHSVGTGSSGNFAVNNLAFQNCARTGNGGAIHRQGSNTGSPTTTISGCIFTSNSATVNGGSIYFDAEEDDLVISNCEFTNSMAATGGAVYITSQNPETIDITNSDFDNCDATASAGAIYASIPGSAVYNLYLEQCTFMNCDAGTGNGGAAVIVGSAELMTCGFEGNSAGGNGGALSISSTSGASTVRLEATGFRGNDATGFGGAIYTDLDLVFGGVGNIIDQNSAGSGAGGIYFDTSDSGSWDADVTAIFNNTASGSTEPQNIGGPGAATSDQDCGICTYGHCSPETGRGCTCETDALQAVVDNFALLNAQAEALREAIDAIPQPRQFGANGICYDFNCYCKAGYTFTELGTGCVSEEPEFVPTTEEEEGLSSEAVTAGSIGILAGAGMGVGAMLVVANRNSDEGDAKKKPSAAKAKTGGAGGAKKAAPGGGASTSLLKPKAGGKAGAGAGAANKRSSVGSKNSRGGNKPRGSLGSKNSRGGNKPRGSVGSKNSRGNKPRGSAASKGSRGNAPANKRSSMGSRNSRGNKRTSVGSKGSNGSRGGGMAVSFGLG